jgi:hypothetical protein
MIRRYGPERGEARLAKRPACPVQVFRVYKQCANSGDGVTQKQGIAIVGRHAPAIATPLDLHPHNGRIFLAGHYQGTRQLASPSLRCIGLVTSRYLLIRYLPAQRCTVFSAASEPSKRQPIEIGDPGWQGMRVGLAYDEET